MQTCLLPLSLLAAAALVVGAGPRVPLSAATPARDECPLAETARGYELAAAWDGSGTPDTAFLAAFAHAAAYRWQVPSRRRAQYTGWQRVRRRLLPPAPRWADDWKPEARHRAVLAVTLYRGGRSPELALLTRSGDERFDRSLESMVHDPMPGSPPLPPLPATVADSLRVLVHLGDRPMAPSASVEFARQQRPVRLVPGTLRVEAPRTGGRSPSATVKYDVSAEGRLAPGSLELLESSSPEFGRAVAEALYRARFSPAESNCSPIAVTVVQTFGS